MSTSASTGLPTSPKQRMARRLHPAHAPWAAKTLFLGILLVGMLGAACLSAVLTARAALKREALVRMDPIGLASITASTDELSGDCVVIVGDSRFAGLPLPPTVAGRPVVNLAVPGASSAQTLAVVRQVLSESSPSLIVVQCGINDLKAAGYGLDREQLTLLTVENLHKIQRLCLDSNVRVILTRILPAGDPPLWRRPIWPRAFGALVDNTNTLLTQPPLSQTLLDLSESIQVHYRDARHFDDQTNAALTERLIGLLSDHFANTCPSE